MYEVVIRKKNKETVSDPMSWGDAFRAYEQDAKTINALNDQGEYLHPEVRISIRKREEKAA